MGWVSRNFDASVSWKDVEWVRSQWDGPLILKGFSILKTRARRRQRH